MLNTRAARRVMTVTAVLLVVLLIPTVVLIAPASKGMWALQVLGWGALLIPLAGVLATYSTGGSSRSTR
jgi:hypothetical protein